MLNDDAPSAEIPTALQESRNRIVGAVRQMLVPAGSDVDTEPFLFMSMERFDLDMIRTAAVLACDLRCDIVCIEFAPGSAALRPHSVHVAAARDGACWIVRDGDLWVDRAGGQVAIVPERHTGHLVCDGEEIVHLPGKPAKAPAPGIARARTAILTRANALPIEDARRYYHPYKRRTS